MVFQALSSRLCTGLCWPLIVIHHALAADSRELPRQEAKGLKEYHALVDAHAWQAPKPSKAHWDYVLEEMKWMAQEFSRWGHDVVWQPLPREAALDRSAAGKALADGVPTDATGVWPGQSGHDFSCTSKVQVIHTH